MKKSTRVANTIITIAASMNSHFRSGGWAQPTYEKRWRSNRPHWRGYWMPHNGAKECARRLRQAAKLEERRFGWIV